jgi:hypothetical protein
MSGIQPEDIDIMSLLHTPEGSSGLASGFPGFISASTLDLKLPMTQEELNSELSKRFSRQVMEYLDSICSWSFEKISLDETARNALNYYMKFMNGKRLDVKEYLAHVKSESDMRMAALMRCGAVNNQEVKNFKESRNRVIQSKNLDQIAVLSDKVVKLKNEEKSLLLTVSQLQAKFIATNVYSRIRRVRFERFAGLNGFQAVSDLDLSKDANFKRRKERAISRLKLPEQLVAQYESKVKNYYEASSSKVHNIRLCKEQIWTFKEEYGANFLRFVSDCVINQFISEQMAKKKFDLGIWSAGEGSNCDFLS